MFLVKEKSLFQNMNFLKEKNHIYHGYCWVPLVYEESVMELLRKIGQEDKNIVTGQLQISSIGDMIEPPTYFKTNDFTIMFQVFFK